MPEVIIARPVYSYSGRARKDRRGPIPVVVGSFFETGCDVHERTGIDDDLRNEIFVA